jgi:general secretion pathway protein D
MLGNIKAEVSSEKPASVATAKKSKLASGPDAELLENVRATETLRRQAYDEQAKREIGEARAAMEAGNYEEVTRHYGNALKLMNDSAAMKNLRRECEQGVAEGLYRAALEEERIGRRAKALELMEKAVSMRHPKARRQLQEWNTSDDPDANKKDLSEISHRRNDDDYKETRKDNAAHLRRARHLLSVRDIDRALEECELVLVKSPYDQEAIRLRRAIQRKRDAILKQEFQTTREGLIADVGRAWRPVYAPNGRELDEVSTSTVKTQLGDDPERALEQTIIDRMRKMRLPAISFKPPATIIDAIGFFEVAAKDYDRPDIPPEQRGFNFIFRPPETLRAQNADSEESEDFGSSNKGKAAAPKQTGLPVIPMITASNISFYDALKLVCESVDYKFKVKGPFVTVMQKNMSTEEMVTRSYPVVAAFLERMGSASSDIKEMKSAGFGGGSAKKSEEGEENQERDWKEFFSLMGVQWPEGSSILYIKTIGKLRVKNTYENLAELEKALTELNVDQKLVEIEARFVEVGQEDLNSLGFEWILNNGYTLGSGGWLGDKLGFKGAGWTDGFTESTENKNVVNADGSITTMEQTTRDPTGTKVWSRTDLNGSKLKGMAGINAFGGTSSFQNGNRYLSTLGNSISGESLSHNDQFLKVNAFLGSADLSMILHMLSQRTDTDLLSAPKVLTRPGEEAVIKVVTEYIYPTDYDVQLQSSSSSGSTYGGSQSAVLAVVEPQTFTMREVGVMLDVTPTLTDDGNLIDLKLNTQVIDEPIWKNYGMRIPFSGNTSSAELPQLNMIIDSAVDAISKLGAQLTQSEKNLMANRVMSSSLAAMSSLSQSGSETMMWYDAPMEQPFFHVRSIDSSISIYPGATIVMGGLITEARNAMDDKVPILGDIPYIGRLFRSHAEKTVKRNLLIFVTTRLVDVRGREVTIGNDAETPADVKPAPETAAK